MDVEITPRVDGATKGLVVDTESSLPTTHSSVATAHANIIAAIRESVLLAMAQLNESEL